MNKKILEETLPDTWRPYLVKDLRFPPVVLQWMPAESAVESSDAVLCAADVENAAVRFAVFYQRDVTPLQVSFAADRAVVNARRGNLLGIIGMVIAILATIMGTKTGGYTVLIPGVVVGAVIGAFVASRVEMVQMPQLVAMLHSFVGLAAVLVGFAHT